MTQKHTPNTPEWNSNFSEQGLVALMSLSRLTYSDFVTEIKRRVAAGEHVHPYHAACAEVAA